MHPPAIPDHSAKRVHLQGQVQGIGLRPAVLRWAAACNIVGWVANESSGVRIHAEGQASDVTRFLAGLLSHLPEEAVITGQVTTEAQLQGCYQFDVQSGVISTPVSTPIPLDTVVCKQCLAEVMQGKDEHRSEYCFNSCALCGPRYSIVQAMPFERVQTAMARFKLCNTCAHEYADAADRRFHAQTTSCRSCGLALEWTNHTDECQTWSPSAVETSALAIQAGMILAFRGVGGYQLISDATNDAAVATLRQRKARISKPLAVMVKDLAMASTLADVSDSEAALNSRAGPIVLCPALAKNGLSTLVHPGLNQVGILLPTTAYHHLLCASVNKPLVVTSGNREGEPLAYTRQEADEQLGRMSDLMMHHDREIVRPIDDSVVRVIAGQVATIRLARGLAPYTLPVQMNQPLVALGGQQKVAVALCNGRQAILGPHLGDMDTVASQGRFVEQYHSVCQLYDCFPSSLVHDLHPDYFTTRWAQKQDVETLSVQHHHAHVAAGMMEHGWLGETVLGIAFDGTGYGEDHTIWGGEVLLANAREAQRLAHLRPFLLLGAEQAIRHPYRVALSLLHQVFDRHELLRLLNRLGIMGHCEPLLSLLDTPHLHAKTTSVGRLFDGVAALLLSLVDAQYEGEPAMLLEACCDRTAMGSYPWPWTNNELDWRPMIQSLLHDIEDGVAHGTIAMRFHRSMARGIVSILRSYPQYRVVLTGGCFQNKILVELVRELLDDDTRLGLPGVIPCNDGGLAAGQLVVAAARLNCLVV